MERTRTPTSRTDPCSDAAPLHVGVVHAGGDICHIAADTSAEGLTSRLGEYVRGNARYQLWPGDAERVLGLLDAGRAEAAVALYFGRTGERWDRERLVVEAVEAVDPARPRSTEG